MLTQNKTKINIAKVCPTSDLRLSHYFIHERGNMVWRKEKKKTKTARIERNFQKLGKHVILKDVPRELKYVFLNPFPKIVTEYRNNNEIYTQVKS